jgi:hypothetical protein
MTSKDDGERHDDEDREDGGGKEGRRTVDESVPTPEGLTSPDEGADDAPEEPRQSKDYA